MSIRIRSAALFAAILLPAPLLTTPPVFAQQTPPQKPPKTPATPKLPATIAAQVNGSPITVNELASALENFGGQPLLRQLIEAKVLEQEAKRLGVSVTPAEVDAAVKEAKQNIVAQQTAQGGTPMTFAEIAARDGLTDGLVRWSVRRNLLTQKTFEAATAQDKGLPQLDNQIQAAHILIATVPLAPAAPGQEVPKPPSEEDAKKRVEEIKAEIEAGTISFADAAKKYSDDKFSGDKGGDLGYFSHGMMDPGFEQAAFGLSKAGEISSPIKSAYGYHLIQLTKKGVDATAAEKQAYRKEQVATRVQNRQALTQWLGDLIRGAKVTLNPNLKVPPAAANAKAK